MEAREGAAPDESQHWLQHGRRKKRGGPQATRRSGLQFAFYGRTSTTRFQDQHSSRGWQREAAATVTADHGAIVGLASGTPLVSERDFVAVQAVRASRPTKDGRVREYLCTGLLVC